MAWTIPDKGEGADNKQSVLFQEDLEVLVAGMQGIDCVLSGCAVTAQGSPDMTVAVAKGAVLSNGTLFAVTAGNATITTADATHPRIDLVVVNSSGTKAVRAGTAAAAPKPPARTANDVVIAQVWVPAGDTTISTNQIVDKRIIRDRGPLTIKKTTTDTLFNTTAVEQTYFTVTLPSGLFLSGKTLRVKCGGNMLINNGTPTVRLVITYGATTMFSDISTAFTASAVRKPWALDIVMQAQSNTDQAMNCQCMLCNVSAITGPTTGLGDAWSAALCAVPISGSAAIDSDAGDNAFAVKFTMSTSNINNEIVCEYGTAELI